MTETFLGWLVGQGLSPSTVSARVRFLDRILADWGTLDVAPEVVGSYLSTWEGWTRRTYTMHLRSIYTWALETGACTANPVARMKAPPVPRPAPRPLGDAELRAALDRAPDRTVAFLLLGSLAGLRRAEIARMHGHDIDARRIRVHGKGGKVAPVATHPALWELAQRYPRDGWWFPSRQRPGEPIMPGTVGNEVARLFREVGIDRGATHRTRHTFGTNLRRNGVDLRLIQELLRHASLATTALYVGVDDDALGSAVASLVA